MVCVGCSTCVLCCLRCCNQRTLWGTLGRTTFACGRAWGIQRAAFESAPDWASDASQKPAKATADQGIDGQADPAQRTVVDRIIADMALDDPDVVAGRISSGKMNFEDFIATTTVMSHADSSALSIPTGYEKMIQAMTLEERRNPLLFQESTPQVEERISRIARDAAADVGVATTFLQDFASIQRFFARMQSGKRNGALQESMQMAAEYLASKPRRTRRHHESKNKMLKKAGQELREKQARRRGFN
ncbi:EF-hand domain-containing protein [Durusdinium trenchii]|uniref:EF-hand domain-containing protein n=1 Tax=Durusdinium trenchii TaxID=1381693 RepID=A0ABP0NSL1_9DINO